MRGAILLVAADGVIVPATLMADSRLNGTEGLSLGPPVACSVVSWAEWDLDHGQFVRLNQELSCKMYCPDVNSGEMRGKSSDSFLFFDLPLTIALFRHYHCWRNNLVSIVHARKLISNAKVNSWLAGGDCQSLASQVRDEMEQHALQLPQPHNNPEIAETHCLWTTQRTPTTEWAPVSQPQETAAAYSGQSTVHFYFPACIKYIRMLSVAPDLQ